MSRREPYLFLLGAGFNIDSNREAGPVLNSYTGGRIDCGYPLVADVLKLCFGLDAMPMGKSVEDLFADASRNRDYEPLKKLVDRLMEADYYIPQNLTFSGASNSYRQFFEKFHGAHFLTFNYDSLPEILLSQKGQWYPEDGYGVPVATELTFGVEPTKAKSASLVLHLHGSACVYTNEFEIVGNPLGEIAELVPRAEPQYAFDAESMSRWFPRYRRMMSRTGRVRPAERVIAPIPDKSQDLKQVFIRQTYDKALPLVRLAGTLIAVGYSFSDHDRISYDPILIALLQTSERTLIIVSPQAKKLAAKISGEHPGLRIKPIEKTFGDWAADSFRCDGKLHQMPDDNPSTPPSVLKQAIKAVPAVKYALGIGGIISIIAIVRGFRIDFRVAVVGTVVMLVLMTMLLVFAKAASRPQSAFRGPAFILTWFSLVMFMATATALFLSVFFGKPLDLRTLLAPVHAEQTPVEKPGTVDVLPPTTAKVDVTVKRAPTQTVTTTVGRGTAGDQQEPHASTTTNSGSIVNNGGVINNPTINNAAPTLKAGAFELTEEKRNGLLKLLSAQTAPRDTVRIGCTSWSERSCVAAGRFLLLFSEAGWQIEQNKVFRLEPQIPIVGVAITTRTPADEPKEPLPPHQGRWRLMDESHKTIYWAFRSIDIPVGGGTDNTLTDGTLGIYFGSEPQ